MFKNFIVITSINEITEAVRKFAKVKDCHVVVVGDKKSPELSRTPEENITFLSVDAQQELGVTFYEHCPFNHYARKNIGYLYAVQQGAERITDTDDDNIPYESWGEDIPDQETSLIKSITTPQFVNIYKYFTDEFIWPRGLPLDSIRDEKELEFKDEAEHTVAVWQGLADKDPDVDAIYRLLLNKPVTFNKQAPVVLEEKVYCPFNSQNTVWTIKKFFPYLYIPISVSFRFCDILRGYVAQRGLWAAGAKLAFTSASVYQERNEHDFMRDFDSEIPCYQDVRKVVETLDNTELTGDPVKDIITIYESLEKINIVKHEDVQGVTAFVADLNS